MAGWDVQTEQCPDTVVFCTFQGNQSLLVVVSAYNAGILSIFKSQK